MKRVFIFLPENLYLRNDCFLYGVIYSTNNVIGFYVLGTICSDKCQFVSYFNVIGQIKKNDNLQQNVFSKDWFCLETHSNYMSMFNLHLDGEITYGHNLCNITLFLYHKESFVKSKVMRDCDVLRSEYLKFLIQLIQNEPSCTHCKTKKWNYLFAQNLHYAFRTFFGMFVPMLRYLLLCTHTFDVNWALRITNFGSYLLTIVEHLLIVTTDIVNSRFLSVKCITYILARIVDMLLGELLLFYLMRITTSSDIFMQLIYLEKGIVASVNDVVHWLMGSPAGFKLHHQFAQLLGSFFLFHISLWWTFLVIVEPILSAVFKLCIFFGYFGLSFQVAILNDILTIISLHIYCIYVYANRLYRVQLMSVMVLARLFTGRKRLILTVKEDDESEVQQENSHSYTIEQLLFGTISFTVLLFLMPTTIIYYIVFTMIRILLIFISGTLEYIRYWLHVLPVYIFWLSFYRSDCLTNEVKMESEHQFVVCNTCVFRMKPVYTSHWKIINASVFDEDIPSIEIEWTKLFKNILLGKLLHPV